MIYVNKFGMLKITDEPNYFSNDISEETISIFDEWNINEISN
jgi:hypothetical protein